MSTDVLFAALDDAAVKMLDLLSDMAYSDDPDGVKERIKVFDSVVDYAALRAKAEPPKKLGESKFNELHRRFRGDSSETKVRGRRRGSETAEDAPSGGGDAGS
jgi:hypothetical protein